MTTANPYSPTNCAHATRTLVVRDVDGFGEPYKDGKPRFFKECDECGAMQMTGTPPSFIKPAQWRNIAAERERKSTEWYQAQRDAYEARRAAEEDERERRHKLARELTYASDAWKTKRDLVFKREGGICQGCAADCSKIPWHAHHSTYDRLGRELLTDIVLFCRDCHVHHHATWRKAEESVSLVLAANGVEK